MDRQISMADPVVTKEPRPKKEILLVDLCFFEGHHETYFMEILSTLIENGYRVYASCVDNKKLRANIRMAQIQHCQVVDITLSPIDKLFNKMAQFIDQVGATFFEPAHIRYASLSTLLATKRLLSQTNPRLPVFFTHADSALPAVPAWLSQRLFPTQWMGLFIWPSYKASIGIGRKKSRQRYLAEKSLSLASCKAVLVLDPVYQDFFDKQFNTLPTIHLPELVCPTFKLGDDAEAATPIMDQIVKEAGGRKIVSILGSLTRKKNLLLFLEAFSQLDPNRYFALVAGRLKENQYTAEELARIEILTRRLSQNAFIRLDYYIPNEATFEQLIQLSDILFLHYQDHPFSSNILTRAIAHRKPVIVSQSYIMKKTLERYDWEMAVSDKPCDIVQAIQTLASHFVIKENKYAEFMRDHSKEQFKAALLTSCALLTQA